MMPLETAKQNPEIVKRLQQLFILLGSVRLQLQIESGGLRTGLIWNLNLIWRCLFGQSGAPPDRQPRQIRMLYCI